jgi:glycosyltransferase involved in cell wall biosynthesis
MKIVIVSKIPIFPTHGGNRSRIKTLCDELRKMGHEVHFAVLPSRVQDSFDRDGHTRYFGDEHYVEFARRPMASVPFLIKTLIAREVAKFRKSSLSNSIDYRYDEALSAPLRDFLGRIDPDVLIVNYVHYSRILELAPDRTAKILDTHDSFAHEFTQSAEARGLGRADMLLAIQAFEAERFTAMVKDPAKVRIVSHITPDMPRVGVDECIGATFLGSQFDANDVSLRWLAERVMPHVLALQPAFKLVVAGTVCNAIEDSPAIIKIGKVDALGDAYALAPVLANAITKGTGIKIKLLEALAMGVPVVSTRLGVAGIDEAYLSAVTVVEDDDAEGFARALVGMQRDLVQRQVRADRAAESVRIWNMHQRASLAETMLKVRDGTVRQH